MGITYRALQFTHWPQVRIETQNLWKIEFKFIPHSANRAPADTTHRSPSHAGPTPRHSSRGSGSHAARHSARHPTSLHGLWIGEGFLSVVSVLVVSVTPSLQAVAPCVLVGGFSSQLSPGVDPAAHVQGLLRPERWHGDQRTAASAAPQKLPDETKWTETTWQVAALSLFLSLSPPCPPWSLWCRLQTESRTGAFLEPCDHTSLSVSQKLFPFSISLPATPLSTQLETVCLCVFVCVCHHKVHCHAGLNTAQMQDVLEHYDNLRWWGRFNKDSSFLESMGRLWK